jgi:hypothetical protein
MPEAPVLRDVYDKIRVVELQWIPMADGRRLAARLWLPNDAEKKPVPAVLEYIPYRRRDGTRVRDDERHAWMAAQGYVCARVDITGSGDSDGLLRDEYLKQQGEAQFAVPEDKQNDSSYRDTVHIEQSDVPVPPGVMVNLCEAQNTVPVTVHRIVERPIPVRLESIGEGHISQIKMDPATVLVRGPQDILDQTRAIPTQPYPLPPAPAVPSPAEQQKAMTELRKTESEKLSASLGKFLPADQVPKAMKKIGSRTKRLRNRRAMTLRHLVANAALGLWCGALCGRPFSDLGPLRMIDRGLFEKIAPQEMTFGWTIETQIAAARLRAAICEIPVNERRRIGGQQKVSGVTWQRTFAIGCQIVAAGYRTRRVFRSARKAPNPVFSRPDNSR